MNETATAECEHMYIKRVTDFFIKRHNKCTLDTLNYF